MNLFKQIVLAAINSVRFCKIEGKNNRKILRKAPLGLHIEVEQGGILSLNKICPICRKGCIFSVRDKGTLDIGNKAFFNRNCQIAVREKVVIGDDCLFGPNVCIFDHDHLVDENGISRTLFRTKPVIIGDHVWVGANVTILKGVTIGDNVIIGAGSIVTSDVPANTVFVQKREDMYLPYHKN